MLLSHPTRPSIHIPVKNAVLAAAAVMDLLNINVQAALKVTISHSTTYV
jgi:hypothetical protein